MATVLLWSTGVACQSRTFTYYAEASYGNSTFPSRDTDFDTVGLTLGISLNPGDEIRHREVLESNRRIEFASVMHTFAPVKQDAAEDDDGEPHIPNLPPPPKDMDEAIRLVLYGFFLLMASLAGFIGVAAWLKYRKKNGTPQGD